MSLQIIIVEKSGNLRPLLVKQFEEATIYKKCGFKQNDNFAKQHEWISEDNQFTIELFGKCVGRSNNLNNYKFHHLAGKCMNYVYGNCALVAQRNNIHIHLTIEMWKELELNLTSIFPSNEENIEEEEEEEEEEIYVIMETEMNTDSECTNNNNNNCFDGLVSELEEENYLEE